MDVKNKNYITFNHNIRFTYRINRTDVLTITKFIFYLCNPILQIIKDVTLNSVLLLKFYSFTLPGNWNQSFKNGSYLYYLQFIEIVIIKECFKIDLSIYHFTIYR